ncbi:MAG: tetratricopeptide repeat protein [Polyangiaceae bacterium]|nr:tetratricopeptide repeat protein [Polyangiaceae bacterium]
MRAFALGLCLIACASQPPAQPAPAPVAAAAAPPEPSASEPPAAPEPEPPLAAAEPEPPAVAEPEPPAAEPEPPSPEPPVAAAPPAPLPASATARDPRMAAQRPRARALLVTELQALERLHQATPKSSPDRPMLMRRLAEGYVELEYAAEREPGGAKVVQAARKNALKYYLAVRSDYPTFAKLDEVLYYAGYEHERGGNLAQARALYRELGTKFPNSPFLVRIPKKVLGR